LSKERVLAYTIGYAWLRGPLELARVLSARGVELVADVRRFPRSRLPGFSREELEAALRKEGLEYAWLGELGALGSRGAGAGCAVSRTFDAYVARLYAGERELSALEWLAEAASVKRVALLCREASWRACHRQFLADALHARGILVLHILKGGLEQRHEPTACYGLAERWASRFSSGVP